MQTLIIRTVPVFVFDLITNEEWLHFPANRLPEKKKNLPLNRCFIEKKNKNQHVFIQTH